MSSSHAEKLVDPLSDIESDFDTFDEASHESQRGPGLEDVSEVTGKLTPEGKHEAKRAADIQFSDQTDHEGTWEKYRKEKKLVTKWAQVIWPADEGFEIQAKISREARVKDRTWYYKAAIYDLKTNEELLKSSKTGSQSRQTVLDALVEDLRAKLNEKDAETSKVSERSTEEKRNAGGSARRKKDKKFIVPKHYLRYFASDGRR